MNEGTQDTAGRRLPWLAGLLSFILPGIGQVYCGKLVRGLVFGIIYGLAILAILALLAYIRPAPTVLFGLLAFVAALGVVVAAVVDAYRLAVRTRPDYERKTYNRLAVYVLLGLMIQGNSVGYSLHVRATLFEAFRVSAVSMFPTIGLNDRILANKIAYRRAEPQYGDIVLFRPPTGGWRDTYIKRIVALGGDTVEIKDKEVYVNGRILPRELVGPATVVGGPAGKMVGGKIYQERNGRAEYRIFLAEGGSPEGPGPGQITVPAHHCFVLGDNRDESLDSRQFGPIPYALIKGRADYLYWPARGWARFGRLH
ncbi:MAG: signal peptidase I [Planctomycetes bacterium]|nr:signal peptidase I [Planctomycetota bacterium]